MVVIEGVVLRVLTVLYAHFEVYSDFNGEAVRMYLRSVAFFSFPATLLNRLRRTSYFNVKIYFHLA